MITHCSRGHEFSPENTLLRKNGGRVCRACAKLRLQKWAKENRELYNKQRRDWARSHKRKPQNPVSKKKSHLKLRYDLTIERHDAMLTEQDNKCAICLEPFGVPHVDHDHLTGKVRGLLCKGCNSAIGNLKDDPVIVDRASEYLRRANPIRSQ